MEYLVKSKVENLEEGIICYMPDIGKQRMYRQGVDSISKGLKPFKYKRLSDAKKLADICNMLYSTSIWGVYEYNGDLEQKNY